MGPGLDRRAPLFLASTFNKLASLECLIRHGADLRTTNEECSGATCLSVAAERNNALVIRALAAAGAPLQQVMHDGASPLHLACFNLSVEATRGVCGREADANFHTHLQPPHTTLNRPRHTPSHSNYTRLPPTFTALLELGADPNALNKMGAAPVHVMLGAPSRSATPASLVQIATLLKDAGADLDATSGHPAVPASYLAVEQGELDLLCAPPVIRERHPAQHLATRNITPPVVVLSSDLLPPVCDRRAVRRGRQD